MSHFYGTMTRRNGKTRITATGHKSKGITTQAASWAGAVETTLSPVVMELTGLQST